MIATEILSKMWVILPRTFGPFGLAVFLTGFFFANLTFFFTAVFLGLFLTFFFMVHLTIFNGIIAYRFSFSNLTAHLNARLNNDSTGQFGKIPVLFQMRLQQRFLQGPLLPFRNMDRLAGERINAGVIHAG